VGVLEMDVNGFLLLLLLRGGMDWLGAFGIVGRDTQERSLS
jgi:hypothetical protein